MSTAASTGKMREKIAMHNPLTWRQWTVFVLALLILVPSATVLFIELVPMAKETERANFDWEVCTHVSLSIYLP